MLPKSRLPFFGSRFIGHTTARYKESGRSCLFKTAVKVGNKNRPQFYVCNLSFFTTIRKYITLIERHNNVCQIGIFQKGKVKKKEELKASINISQQ